MAVGKGNRTQTRRRGGGVLCTEETKWGADDGMEHMVVQSLNVVNKCSLCAVGGYLLGFFFFFRVHMFIAI